MRALTVLVVATACSSPGVKKVEPPPPPPPVVVEVDAGVIAPPADAAPPIITTEMYSLPPAVVEALGKEKLQGNVLVPVNVAMYPTKDDARVAPPPEDVDLDEGAARVEVMAVRVIADHGETVEVSTVRSEKDKPPVDCEATFAQPYTLTVFVKRVSLIPRSSVAQTKNYPDGTAVAIDAGAAVQVTSHGLRWQSRLLAATKLAPRADQLAYSGKPAVTALAAMPGVQMYCDEGDPLSAAELTAQSKTTDWPCGTVNPASISSEEKAAPPPSLGGVQLSWVAVEDRALRVFRQWGGKALADVEGRCGRLRVVPDPASIRAAAEATSGVRNEEELWVAAKGPVTWPDGKPAGQFDGTEPLDNPEKRAKDLCVRIASVVAPVCHPLKTAKRKKVQRLKPL